MEFPAASAHRVLVPWLGLLLAASLIPPSTTRFAVVSSIATEGQDVILGTQNRPPGVTGFRWYRGVEIKYANLIGCVAWNINQYITGPEYSGGETAKLDGSLIIRKVTPSDLGIYIVEAALWNSQREIGFGWLNVYRPVSVPTILVSSTTAIEKKDAVIMTCQTNASSTSWLFNAESLQLRERMKLSQDHRTLTIDPVRREDAGNYLCQVSNPISSIESAPIKLDVKY